MTFTLPGSRWGATWVKELDTARGWLDGDEIYHAEGTIEAAARSLVVLRNH